MQYDKPKTAMYNRNALLGKLSHSLNEGSTFHVLPLKHIECAALIQWLPLFSLTYEWLTFDLPHSMTFERLRCFQQTKI